MVKPAPVRVIEKADIPALISMEQCIELVDACMREVSAGNAELPLRWGVRAGNRGAMGMMPGYLGNPECFGIKLVSLFPGNAARGLSSHSGLMVLFEPEFGQPVAMMDAGYLTAVRTAAASGVATRALARENAATVAILGTGEQARFHGPAMAAVRPVEHIWVWGRSPEKAQSLAADMHDSLDIPVNTAATASEALALADIICSVTSASEPILRGQDLQAGCHVNAVGASIPPNRELDLEAVKRSRLFVDYRPSALAQAAELMEAIEQGQLNQSHIRAEIGEVLLGDFEGRQSPNDITLYRSMGVAAQDLAAAHHIYTRATEAGAGTLVRI